MRYLFLFLFGIMGLALANAQTITNEQIQLLEGSITQSNAQAQTDIQDIALDNADIQSKTADLALMQQQMQAAGAFLEQLSQMQTNGEVPGNTEDVQGTVTIGD